jgi:hypothetical protein
MFKIIIKFKYTLGRSGTQFQVEKMIRGRSPSSLNDSYTLSNAKMKNKRLTKCIGLKEPVASISEVGN